MQPQIAQLTELGFTNFQQGQLSSYNEWTERTTIYHTLTFGTVMGEYQISTKDPTTDNYWSLKNKKGDIVEGLSSANFQTILNYFKGDDGLTDELRAFEYLVGTKLTQLHPFHIKFCFNSMKASIGMSRFSGYGDSRWSVSKDGNNYTLIKNLFAPFTECGNGGYWHGEEIIMSSTVLSDLVSYINENGGTTL